jgi:hypothetical protein
MRWVHIAAGLIGIGSGAIALAALKGASLVACSRRRNPTCVSAEFWHSPW